MPVTDVTAVIGSLTFDNGAGLTAPPEKRAMALQTPRILTVQDEALLRAATAGPAASPAPAAVASAGTVATAPLASRLANPVDALRSCAAVLHADPAGAFELALQAWRQTRWQRLAEVVEQLGARAETPVAARIRDRIRRGALPQKEWLEVAAATLPVDRSALLAWLQDQTAKDAAARMETALSWEPDPRVGAVVADMIRRKPWTYTESGPTWTRLFKLLAATDDRRLLSSGRLDIDAMRVYLGRFPDDWLTERIVKAVARLAAALPYPPVTAEAEALLDSLAVRAAAGRPVATARPAPPVVDRAPLPASVASASGPGFDVFDVVEVRSIGTGDLLLGLSARSADAEPSEVCDAAVLVTLDGATRWAHADCVAAALDPAGDRVAVVLLSRGEATGDTDGAATGMNTGSCGIELIVARISDGDVLARRRLAEVPAWRYRGHGGGTVRVVWAGESAVVGLFGDRESGRLYQCVPTGADPTVEYLVPASSRGDLAVDQDSGLVAACWGSYMLILDTRSGRVTQAFQAGRPSWNMRKKTGHHPITGLHGTGGGRFAFRCNGAGFTDPGQAGSVAVVVDGFTGWCLTETPVEERAGTVATLPDGRLAVLTVDGVPAASISVQPAGCPTGLTSPWASRSPRGSGRGMAPRRTRGRAGPICRLTANGSGPVRRIATELPAVNRLAVSGDGSVLAAASGGTGLLWGTKKPLRLLASGGDEQVRAVAVSAHGSAAFAMNNRAEIRTPDGAQGRVAQDRPVLTSPLSLAARPTTGSRPSATTADSTSSTTSTCR